jgi:hypothetical protein
MVMGTTSTVVPVAKTRGRVRAVAAEERPAHLALLTFAGLRLALPLGGFGLSLERGDPHLLVFSCLSICRFPRQFG